MPRRRRRRRRKENPLLDQSYEQYIRNRNLKQGIGLSITILALGGLFMLYTGLIDLSVIFPSTQTTIVDKEC